MKNKIIPVLLGVVVAAVVLVVTPLLLLGDRTERKIDDALTAAHSTEVIVYSETTPDGLSHPDLTSAIGVMSAGIPVGSAVATSAVYGANVIIARNHDTWRTIPEGIVFYLDAANCSAEVFIDRGEFGVFLKKFPELARQGVGALDLEEFLRAFRDKKSLTTGETL